MGWILLPGFLLITTACLTDYSIWCIFMHNPEQFGDNDFSLWTPLYDVTLFYRKGSCGKVMFLQPSVCSQWCVVEGVWCRGWCLSVWGCLPVHSPKMVTAVGGMHPTGTHTYYLVLFLPLHSASAQQLPTHFLLHLVKLTIKANKS